MGLFLNTQLFVFDEDFRQGGRRRGRDIGSHRGRRPLLQGELMPDGVLIEQIKTNGENGSAGLVAPTVARGLFRM